MSGMVDELAAEQRMLVLVSLMDRHWNDEPATVMKMAKHMKQFSNDSLQGIVTYSTQPSLRHLAETEYAARMHERREPVPL